MFRIAGIEKFNKLLVAVIEQLVPKVEKIIAVLGVKFIAAVTISMFDGQDIEQFLKAGTEVDDLVAPILGSNDNVILASYTTPIDIIVAYHFNFTIRLINFRHSLVEHIAEEKAVTF